MNAETITSRQNPLMTHLRKLASSRSYRKKSGEYLCDGTKLLAEALKWGAEVKTAVFSERVDIPLLPDGVRAVRVSEELMHSVSPMETPQGALFTVALPEVQLPETLSGKHYLVLDGVQDPGNCGTIIRTCDAAGFAGVVLGPGCADPFSPKGVRATMGSLFRVPLLRVPDLSVFLTERREMGWPILVSALEGEDFYARPRLPERLVLVIGSEGRGVSAEVSACATHRFKLPMVGGAESLNASVAAGVLIYDLFRERHYGT